MYPKTKYKLGDIVYHLCADDNRRGIITTIQFNLSGGFSYGVTWGCNANQYYHFEKELTTEYTPDFGVHSQMETK